MILVISGYVWDLIWTIYHPLSVTFRVIYRLVSDVQAQSCVENTFINWPERSRQISRLLLCPNRAEKGSLWLDLKLDLQEITSCPSCVSALQAAGWRGGGGAVRKSSRSSGKHLLSETFPFYTKYLLTGAESRTATNTVSICLRLFTCDFWGNVFLMWNTSNYEKDPAASAGLYLCRSSERQVWI